GPKPHPAAAGQRREGRRIDRHGLIGRPGAPNGKAAFLPRPRSTIAFTHRHGFFPPPLQPDRAAEGGANIGLQTDGGGSGWGWTVLQQPIAVSGLSPSY